MHRWILLRFLFFCTLGIVIYGVQASDNVFFLPEEFAGVKVVIDPGHGGLDGGASAGDIVERDITLSISHEVAKKLKKKGAIVVMTREKSGDALAEHAAGDQLPSVRSRTLADRKLHEDIT